MTDRTTNPQGQEVHRLDDADLERLAVSGPTIEAPEGTVWIRSRPYLTARGLQALADHMEAQGDHQGAAALRQRAQERRRAFEDLVARGLSGTKAEKIVLDDIGAAVPERDPVPGHVRFLIMVLLAGTGLIFSLPIIIRALFAFFRGF